MTHVAGALLCLLGASELTLEEVVQAHATTIGLVHSFDVRFELTEYLSFDAKTATAQPLDSPRLDLSCQWTVDGDRERLYYRAHTAVRVVDDVPIDRGVFVANSTDMRVLVNWNSDAPPEITPTRQGPIRGLIVPRAASAPGFPTVTTNLLRTVSLGLTVEGVTLQQALRPFKEVSIEKVSPQGSAVGIYRIRAGSPQPGCKADQLEAEVDPEKGFLIRRLDIIENVDFVGKRRVLREVKSFRDCGDGIFFPELVEQTIWIPGKAKASTSFVTTQVTTLDVNQPISPERFTLPFPKDLLVGVHQQDGSYELQLWGPDDSPIETITDMKQLGFKAQTMSWFYAPVLVLLTGVLGLAVYWFLTIRGRRPRRGE